MGADEGPGLSERESSVLERIVHYGAFTCTGSCHQREPGQVHCMNLAGELGLTNKMVWKTVVRLVDTGLMERRRDEEARCWRFSPTEEGRRAVAGGHNP